MPEINSPESIIVYGGSFNPLHMSHVLVHAALSAYFPLAQKWIVASYSHAFDKRLMDYERRLSVLRSVFGQSPQTVVSDIEARIGKTPTYTIDVVRAIGELYPDRAVWIVGGSDLVASLDKWHEIDELRRMAKFVFFPRAGVFLSLFLAVGYEAPPSLDDAILPMIALPELSSSEVRAAIARKDAARVRMLVPAAAYEDLVAHGDL